MCQANISIIVPVHNAAGTLEDAIDSALSQTYRNMELILVDDGGTDGSPALCDAAAERDSRVRAFHMEDRGVSAARNFGLEKARGEYIAFLDADDVLHPSLLMTLLTMLEKTGADYAGCGFEKRHEGEAPFAGRRSAGDAGDHHAAGRNIPGAEGDAAEAAGEGAPSADTTAEEMRTAGDGKEETVCMTELTGAQIITEGTLHPDHPDTRVWSKLFRRDYIGSTRFREGLTIGEDMLFLVDLVRADTRYVQTQEQLYSYYINPHGAMERPFAPNHMDTLRCRNLAEEIIRGRFPELASDEDAAARLAAQQLIAAVLTASKIARLPADQQAQYEKEFGICRQAIRTHCGVPGASAFLPKGYSLKIQLLLRAPGIYRKLYR